jgi:membrane-associated phospholipid phosphatase
MMGVPARIGETQPYAAQLLTLIGRSAAQLVRRPAAPHRPEAARRLRLQTLLLVAGGAVLIVALMFGFDAAEIARMPPRKSPQLWPVEILTDFGKDEYVMAVLAAAAAAIALAFPLVRGVARTRLLRLGIFIEYLFLSVLVPTMVTELIKRAVGRGRPFVGGKADPFNFLPFHGAEPYFSFPSAHAVTAFALALGIAAIRPAWRIPMFIYAVAIAASRLVLLAHHPSDVVGGAVAGLVGALCLRYWFAARQLGFAIENDGKIVSHEPHSRGVARNLRTR